jgi:TRAP-type C4-dicarboxylate transport system permease small subunit
MDRLERIANIISRISIFSAYFAMTGLLFLFLVIFIEIILRTFFLTSLEFHVTVAMWLLILLTWMGASWTLRVGGHIQITLFTARFSPRSKSRIEICIAAVGVAFFVFFSWYAWELCIENIKTGATDQSIWHIPKWYAWIPFCLGANILMLQFIGIILDHLVFLKKLRKPQENR